MQGDIGCMRFIRGWDEARIGTEDSNHNNLREAGDDRVNGNMVGEGH